MDLASKSLLVIPGVGKAIARDLVEMGYSKVADIKDQDPDEMYLKHNDLKGSVQDICMLYTFRCAVYFASTPAHLHDPQKLKWWHWMDAKRITSSEMDAALRKKRVQS